MATTSAADMRHGAVGVPTGILLGWSDTRWGATEIYDELVTLPACGM
jgi:hypothetical protein